MRPNHEASTELSITLINFFAFPLQCLGKSRGSLITIDLIPLIKKHMNIPSYDEDKEFLPTG